MTRKPATTTYEDWIKGEGIPVLEDWDPFTLDPTVIRVPVRSAICLISLHRLLLRLSLIDYPKTNFVLLEFS